MIPSISLVICTLGRTAELQRLLASLRLQDFENFEAIIVDQNPPDFLAPHLRQFKDLPLRVIRSAKGLSRARNAGLRVCQGEIIGFPDDDCWYDGDVLSKVAGFFATSPDVGILTGRTVDAGGGESVSRFQRQSGPITRTNCFVTGSSSALFVRRSVNDQIGGFDEELGVGASTPYQSGEETDYVLRGLAAEFLSYFERSHIVRHDQVALKPERARAYSTGFGQVIRKHQLGHAFLATRSSRTLAAGAYRLLRGDLDGAKQRYEWLMGSVQGYLSRNDKQDTTPRSTERGQHEH